MSQDAPSAPESEATLSVEKSTGDEIQASEEEISGSQLVAAAYCSNFQGPLPPPAILERYEGLLPGAAERVFSAWEKETQHRQDVEKVALRAEIQSEKRGQWLGLCLALVSMAVAVYLVQAGHSAAGIALILAEIGALAGAFLIGRWDQARRQHHGAEEAQAGEPESPEGQIP